MKTSFLTLSLGAVSIFGLSSCAVYDPYVYGAPAPAYYYGAPAFSTVAVGHWGGGGWWGNRGGWGAPYYGRSTTVVNHHHHGSSNLVRGSSRGSTQFRGSPVVSGPVPATPRFAAPPSMARPTSSRSSSSSRFAPAPSPSGRISAPPSRGSSGGRSSISRPSSSSVMRASLPPSSSRSSYSSGGRSSPRPSSVSSSRSSGDRRGGR